MNDGKRIISRPWRQSEKRSETGSAWPSTDPVQNQ